MPKKIYSCSDDEVEVLRLGRDDPDIITNYFFRPEGATHGWILDENFDPEGAWQKPVHLASQKRILVIGGFGSGKTKGIAISACVWCMTTQDFMFMNCAPTSWQSELMYKFIMDTLARDTPFGRLIHAWPKRPYPTIDLKFYVKNTLVHSTLEFMSVDKNASAILSWDGDWVHIDEAGLIDDLEGTITHLGTRMRGKSRDRPRLARLSMASNSWDNPELWYRYDLARELPNDYLSLTVSSRHNHNITEEQLRLMLKDVPEDEHEQFIEGMRPEGRGNYFNKNKIYNAEDKTYGDFVVAGVENGLDGYEIRQTYGAGVTFFRTPRVDSHIYVLTGDPGTGDAPNRNAPVCQVWDVTEFPKLRASLVALYWGRGNGSITPWTVQLLKFMEIYNPVWTCVDNTGTQKNTAELLNTYIQSNRHNPDSFKEWLGDVDLSKVLNVNIDGLDFSGGHKPAFLIMGRILLEAGLMTWPKFVTGMRSQLTNYDPEKDRPSASGPKLAQDLVATYCMASWAIADLFRIDPATVVQKKPVEDQQSLDQTLGREARFPREDRELATIRG